MSGHEGVKAPGGTTFYFGVKPDAAPTAAGGDIPALLAALADRLDACLADRPFKQLALDGPAFEGITSDTLQDVLGEGEIKLWVREPGFVTEVADPAMPGLWRLSRRSEAGDLVQESIDAGPFPRLVNEVMERQTAGELQAEAMPDGTLSAGPILQEIGHHMALDVPHTIVLTNLPMSPLDMDVLNNVLGEGPVAGGSKGYSTTRVRSTHYRRVWRVNYLNSDGQVIYDAIEITHAPLSLAAPREDIEDGRDRLTDLIRIHG